MSRIGRQEWNNEFPFIWHKERILQLLTSHRYAIFEYSKTSTFGWNFQLEINYGVRVRKKCRGNTWSSRVFPYFDSWACWVLWPLPKTKLYISYKRKRKRVWVLLTSLSQWQSESVKTFKNSNSPFRFLLGVFRGMFTNLAGLVFKAS